MALPCNSPGNVQALAIHPNFLDLLPGFYDPESLLKDIFFTIPKKIGLQPIQNMTQFAI
jgi:hypothetical protein